MKPPNAQTTRTQSPARKALEPSRRRVPGLVILAHPDRGRLGEEVALTRLASGEKVALSRLEPAFAAPGSADCRALGDPHLSRSALFLLSGRETGGVRLDDSETQNRVRVFLRGEREASSHEFSVAEVERGVVLVLNDCVALLLHPVDPIPEDLPRFGLVGDSIAIRRLRQEIRSAAELDVPVLLRGETGTGKELVARALHAAGRRGREPYVAVNMATLPPTLAPAALFGAARGAYTGADRRKTGYFESARKGTLFLDEIGEAPIEVQALLLRALETREIQPVGSVASQPFHARVIAATDADLESEIGEGRFRAPLLHRLAGYEIRLPALRERRDDIARLLDLFLRQEIDGLGASLPGPGETPWPAPALVARLVDEEWPGNVRQLRNVARRLAIARRDGSDAEELHHLVETLLGGPSALLPAAARPATPEPTAISAPDPAAPRRAAEVSESELLEALERNQWRPRPTARALRISPTALYRRIDRCPRIRKAGELARGEVEEALHACDGDRDAAARRLRVSPQGLRRRMTELDLTEERGQGS